MGYYVSVEDIYRFCTLVINKQLFLRIMPYKGV